MNRRNGFAVEDCPRPDLREYAHKDLASGTWITFHDLDPDVTDQEISDMIAARTGVTIPIENIQLKAFSPKKIGAIVSVSKHEISGIIGWALAEDTLRGRRFYVASMKSAKY